MVNKYRPALAPADVPDKFVPVMVPDPLGGFVRAVDYDTKDKECEALKARLGVKVKEAAADFGNIDN